MTIPVQPVDQATLYATAQGGPRPVQAWSRIEDSYLKLSSAVPWQTDNNPRQLSFCGWFKTSF